MTDTEINLANRCANCEGEVRQACIGVYRALLQNEKDASSPFVDDPEVFIDDLRQGVLNSLRPLRLGSVDTWVRCELSDEQVQENIDNLPRKVD
jgi:hypothetical protein